MDLVPCTHFVVQHVGGDLYPCGYGVCSYPCEHWVPLHAVDSVPCTHPAHLEGHVEEVCH